MSLSSRTASSEWPPISKKLVLRPIEAGSIFSRSAHRAASACSVPVAGGCAASDEATTPQGMFSLQVLGAVAQLERALISERTKAGIKAAKSKGKLPGNPGIRERRPEALAKITAAQKAAFGARIQATANQWLPTVRRMRPDHTWDDIARVLKQRGLDWTPERLRRAVKWLVAEHLADPALLRKSPPRLPEDRLMTLVAGMHVANPELTLREIAGQLERLHERTPRGGSKWSPSSVRNLIDRAHRTGLIDAEPAPPGE